MMKVTMWWGDDSYMTKLGTSECNSPPPTSNSLGSYYSKIVWRYCNQKERVRKHNTLTAFNEPRRPCSPKILTHNSDL